MHRLTRIRFTSGLSGEGYREQDSDGRLEALFDAVGEQFASIPNSTWEHVRDCGAFKPNDHARFWDLVVRDVALARQLAPGRDAEPFRASEGGGFCDGHRVMRRTGYGVAPGRAAVGKKPKRVELPDDGTVLLRDLAAARLADERAFTYDVSVDGGRTWLACWDAEYPTVLTASGDFRIYHVSEARDANAHDAGDPAPWYFEPMLWREGGVFSEGHRTAREALAAAERWEAANPEVIVERKARARGER